MYENGTMEQMHTCKLCEKSNVVLVEIFDNMITEYSPVKVQEKLNIISNTWENTSIHNLCMECVYCLDFYHYLSLVEKYVKPNFDRKELVKEIYSYQKIQHTDLITSNLMENPVSIYNNASPVNIDLNDYTKVYIDQNILSDYTNQRNLRKKLDFLKEKYSLLYLYSPAHLEEVYKISSNNMVKRFTDSITELTDNHIIFPYDYPKIVIENPLYSLQRVSDNIELTELMEIKNLNESKVRDLLFDQYNSEEHRRIINNQVNPFTFTYIDIDKINEILSYTHSSLNYYSFINKEININNFAQLHNGVFALSKYFDTIGYKIDKSERTIRSNTHDIEHLVYAKNADYLITKDKNMKARATQIYKNLSIKTTVLNLAEFKKFSF